MCVASSYISVCKSVIDRSVCIRLSSYFLITIGITYYGSVQRRHRLQDRRIGQSATSRINICDVINIIALCGLAAIKMPFRQYFRLLLDYRYICIIICMPTNEPCYVSYVDCNCVLVSNISTTVLVILGLWLRLECSLDCISGSVGHQQNIFIFSLSAFLLKLKKCNYKKFNWVSGSPSILYKLVLSPVPIVHTNFQENLLMSYSWCPQLSR